MQDDHVFSFKIQTPDEARRDRRRPAKRGCVVLVLLIASWLAPRPNVETVTHTVASSAATSMVFLSRSVAE